MLAIALTFPARRFHATPWGRQVNEGAVEWPPSPWRLLRALVAAWHYKFPEVPEGDLRALIDRLTLPPSFVLPPASQGHTRHFMPLADGSRTKVFDTFIALDSNAEVVAIWPELALAPGQRELLGKLLESMTYLGRAESWISAKLLDECSRKPNVLPLELGIAAPTGFELVRTLVAVSPDEHSGWVRSMRQENLAEKGGSVASSKKSPSGKPKKKADQALDDGLPETLFDALHADTSALRKAGWNQPPGSRWIHYCRPGNAFAPDYSAESHRWADDSRPTVARFAVCGAVRPLFTEALAIGERVRAILMGCSKALSGNAAQVFSGKHADGSRLDTHHQHAHFLCEASGGEQRITHLTIYAPMGFDAHAHHALQRLAACGVWGKGGHDLQLVLLGIGQPGDFGGPKEQAGQSRLLATAAVWESRTPFVPTRHLARKSQPDTQAISRDPKLQEELANAARFELARRPQFAALAKTVRIELLLEQAGTDLGGHFTSWLKFRRERLTGAANKAGSQGFGLRLTFQDSHGIPVSLCGPIALGYGAHFGLGQFIASRRE